MVNPRYEHFKDFSSNDMSFAEKKKVWLEISDMTEAEFDALQAAHDARQAGVPRVGDTAPDFAIERLDRGRRRTGEIVSLSSLRGRTVALCFGSYT